ANIPDIVLPEFREIQWPYTKPPNGTMGIASKFVDRFPQPVAGQLSDRQFDGKVTALDLGVPCIDLVDNVIIGVKQQQLQSLRRRPLVEKLSIHFKPALYLVLVVASHGRH